MYNSLMVALTANKQTTMITRTEVLTFVVLIVLFALGIAYLAWLDHGCALSGAMTWHGKICVQ